MKGCMMTVCTVCLVTITVILLFPVIVAAIGALLLYCSNL